MMDQCCLTKLFNLFISDLPFFCSKNILQLTTSHEIERNFQDIFLTPLAISHLRLRANFVPKTFKKNNCCFLITNLDKKDFKKSTLGGCIFFKKGENLCLKVEKF